MFRAIKLWKKNRELSADCGGWQGVLPWRDIDGCGKIKMYS